MKIFGREPTVVLQSISALLSIIVTFGVDWLTAEQQVLLVAFIGAAFGLLNALMVQPWAPGAFIAFVTAGAALLTGYGLTLSPELVGAITAAVPVLLALQIRGQVTPTASPAPREYSV